MPTEIKLVSNGHWLYRLEFKDGEFTGNVEREPFNSKALSESFVEINGIHYHRQPDYSGLARIDSPSGNAVVAVPRKKERQRNLRLVAAALLITVYGAGASWSILNYGHAQAGKTMADIAGSPLKIPEVTKRVVAQATPPVAPAVPAVAAPAAPAAPAAVASRAGYNGSTANISAPASVPQPVAQPQPVPEPPQKSPAAPKQVTVASTAGGTQKDTGANGNGNGNGNGRN